MREDERQKSTRETDEDKSLRKMREFTAELELLNDIKEVMTMKSGAGKRVLLNLIAHTEVMANPFTNNGYTAFTLGVQSVGRKLIKGITDAGCKLEIPDIMRNQNIRRVDTINEELNKLQKGVKK